MTRNSAGLLIPCFLFACSCHRGAATSDEEAWRAMAKMTSNQTVKPPPGDSAAGWRVWSTQEEIYVGPGQPPLPDSSQRAYRPLNCRPIAQQAFFSSFLSDRARALAQGDCQVVFLNRAAGDFVLKNRLYIREYLSDAAVKGNFSMPKDSQEIKTIWRKLDPGARNDYIVGRGVDNNLYGLVAVHFMTSHNVRPKWLWATWIHKNFMDQVPIHDSFGWAAGGKFPSANLLGLLNEYSVPQLGNYRLIGTQTDFDKPKLLGNPLIETDLVKQQQASCIACHYTAQIRATGGWHVPEPPPVGIPAAVPAAVHVYAVDFDYSLVFGSQCYNMKGKTCETTLASLDKASSSTEKSERASTGAVKK